MGRLGAMWAKKARLARVNSYTRRGYHSDLTQQTSATQSERLPCVVSFEILAMVMSLELRGTSTTIGGLLTCRSRRRRAGRRWLFEHEDTLVSCDPAQPRCIESTGRSDFRFLGCLEHEQEETRRNVEAVRRNRKGEKTKRDWKQYTYTQKHGVILEHSGLNFRLIAGL